MNIYFAGSIRGGRDDQALYAKIVVELQKYGTVLTEHIGDKALSASREAQYSDKEIFEKDINLIDKADLIVAEVTNVSLGVGYELGRPESLKKPAICLFREIEDKRLSAMINGNSYFKVITYKDFEDVSNKLRGFFNK